MLKVTAKWPHIVVLSAALVLLMPAMAWAEDMRGALGNYASNRQAQLLDDKCHILNSEERPVIDTFVQDVQAYVVAKAPREQDTLRKLDETAQTAAAAESCGTAAKVVRDAYEDRLANSLALAVIPYAWAMDVGERCEKITPDEDNQIMKLYLARQQEVQQKYGTAFFGKYAMIVHQADDKSQTFSCSDARKMIDAVIGK
ncbi:hypothetical protein [Nitrospirillum pindoramense]|uniref:Lysozyme inhibitor LprI N-terminal domain-containing protein n=1 Tax=Nitrospirillum amazonense TaxID=28077 RepID=A0A560HLC2_9PROT|nr:hypothetical protein [Nitrospirillum amazonense]TWB46124.1 hypothetical protein FBZ90_101459 [Nitrospirillum amazonense]